MPSFDHKNVFILDITSSGFVVSFLTSSPPLLQTVQLRGAAVIKARKLSSAMSAAKAICDHMRDIWFGTKDGEFTSMGVYAGGNSYGIPEDLIYSFPIEIKNKTWKMVGGLPINDFSRAKMDATAAELVEERDTAMDFLSQ
ncbi:malate dehydrogenase, cytoplasmic-like [Notothenia coriiceps]|uniref:Malate dehydrogenase, cytoplasmic-like n=1 Tax=Notothenia coriiceps TaxID=8208 RepID=A0A6I9NEL7_9TELE|nr:PREDICTED: malate dehydrogenase, cytoplasmic-like [Notothenia coriiceps]